MYNSRRETFLWFHKFLINVFLGYMFLEINNATDVESDVENNFSINNLYHSTVQNSQATNSATSFEDVFADVIIGTGKLGNFWEEIVRQCREQLNVKTTEQELRDSVLSEISEYVVFYSKKFDMQEDVLVDLCRELDDKLHYCQVNLDIVSSALSSILHCQVVQLDTKFKCSKIFEGRTCDNFESPIYYCISKDETLVKVCSVTFKKETLEKYKHMSSLSLNDTIYDGVGRVHMKTPYSGEANVVIRSHKYNATSIATHVTNLYEMLKPIKETKSVFMFLSDGGPDFNPAHIANELFYYRLFKELNADILGVMTYAARYSAFNPIEHLWAPLSNHLSGVVFSPLVDGDKAAPAFQSSLSEETTKGKESVVFDRAMNDIKEKHWKDLKFDGFQVHVSVVPCNKDNLLFDDYDKILSE